MENFYEVVTQALNSEDVNFLKKVIKRMQALENSFCSPQFYFTLARLRIRLVQARGDLR